MLAGELRLSIRVEVPKGAHVKRDASGRAELRSPLPCPFNYGSLPGSRAPDGDPVDAVLLGPRLGFGAEASAPLRAVVHFIDAGRFDPKLILSSQPLSRWQRAQILSFFSLYAAGKRALDRLGGGRECTANLGFGAWPAALGPPPPAALLTAHWHLRSSISREALP